MALPERSVSPRADFVGRSPLCGDTPQLPSPCRATVAPAAHRLDSFAPRTVTSGLHPERPPLLRAGIRPCFSGFHSTSQRGFSSSSLRPPQAAACTNTRRKTALALPTAGVRPPSGDVGIPPPRTREEAAGNIHVAPHRRSVRRGRCPPRSFLAPVATSVHTMRPVGL